MERQKNKLFLVISSIILISLPIFMSAYIFYVTPRAYIFSGFLLLVMVSFGMGVKDEMKYHRLMNLNLILGIFLSLIQAGVYSIFKAPTSLITFPLYLWVWLSMYNTGLYISMKNLNEIAVLHALITSLAGIGTLSWLWIAS